VLLCTHRFHLNLWAAPTGRLCKASLTPRVRDAVLFVKEALHGVCQGQIRYTRAMNTSRLVLNVVLCGLLLPCAQAVTLRIYPEFTEIRRPVHIQNRLLELNFSQVQLGNMVGGSLYLSGPKVLSRLQTVNSGKGSLERFEGQVVYLREAGQVRAVRLVRASDGLVQDLKTLRFRSGISLAQLEFAKPPLPGLESTVRYRYTTASSGPATVSLITRGISWQPRYVLSVTDSGSSLEAWADITNHEATLKVDSSELIAGQVQLVSSSGSDSPMYDVAPKTYAKVMPMVMNSRSYSPPRVGNGNEQHGIYNYTIDKGYTLPANSTYSLPFLNATVSTKRFVRVNTYFSGNFEKGKFQRIYQLSSNVLLPAGIATIRDEGRVVGSQNFPNLSAFEDYDLQMGKDPDVSYTRYIKQEKTTKTKTFGDTLRTYDYNIYTIGLQIKNPKNKAVFYEYSEDLSNQYESNRYRFSGSGVESSVMTVEGAMQTGQSLKLKSTIPANTTISLKYKVIFLNTSLPQEIIRPSTPQSIVTTPKSKP
jgi:hypothetical protein